MINKMVTYKVRKDAVDEVKMFVREFVENIKLNEEGTLLYRALQHSDDPTKFIHFMTFEDEYAEDQHRNSNYNEEFMSSIEEFCDGRIDITDLSRLAFHD